MDRDARPDLSCGRVEEVDEFYIRKLCRFRWRREGRRLRSEWTLTVGNSDLQDAAPSLGRNSDGTPVITA
jgi:hypothetical protein